MIKGEETHLFVFGLNKRVSFYSTNFRVAGVNFNGRVFAYQTGKAFIIAKVDGKELKCRVHVIDINKETIELKVGNTYRLSISGAMSFKSWKSENNYVATVNMFGKVKAKHTGKTVIIAKVKGRSLKCTVYVK
ncbi:MAG: Ig-like domain-containing protein [Herbinix sp.]|nr:Ig-like domain-containing protein [Herbinix sp.]